MLDYAVGRTETIAVCFNPLNAELNPICHLLALLAGATIVVASRLRVKGKTCSGNLLKMTSLVVWWSELLTTNHEVPGSIPGSTIGIFPCRGRIPVVTMVWVVSRIRLKVETSVTRSHNSINSDRIHDRDLLAGGDLTTRDNQHISS